jgi:cytosine deaminase
MDLIIRNARLLQEDELRLVDIGIRGSTIAAIEQTLQAEAQELDATGCLLVPGLIETHIHLDKTCILDRCRIEEGTIAEAVRETAAAKRNFTIEDVYARAKQTLQRCIAHGTMRMRTHVELDPGIGMIGLEAISQLARDYAWAMDVELCVFPQEGLTNNPGTEELLIEGLRRGARAIGAVPYFDTDPRHQIDRISTPKSTCISISPTPPMECRSSMFAARPRSTVGAGGSRLGTSPRCRCCRRTVSARSRHSSPAPALR